MFKGKNFEEIEELMNEYKKAKEELKEKNISFSEYIEELKNRNCDEATIKRYEEYKKIDNAQYLENDVLDLKKKMKPFPPQEGNKTK